MPPIHRRQCLQAAATVTAAAFMNTRPLKALPDPTTMEQEQPPLKIGLIADLHFGLEPTAGQRLESFMDQVAQEEPDAILQLGDFNYGDRDSSPCTELWNSFERPRFHVLGNHDMDRSRKQQMVELWEMPGRYYSVDTHGIHIVVLDRNNLLIDGKYTPYDTGNYYQPELHRGHADPEQLDWLKEDLARNQLPAIIFVHQGLGMPEQRRGANAIGPHTAIEPIEAVLAGANRSSSNGPVVACFCGHHHIDRYQLKDAIHYVWINSASYYWVGEPYGRMAAYRDPLFCFVTIDRTGHIKIAGRSTEWVAPSPEQRGYPKATELNTHILDRDLKPARDG